MCEWRSLRETNVATEAEAGLVISSHQIRNAVCLPPKREITDKASYYRDLMYDFFEAMRSASQGDQQELLRMIRHHAPMHQIRVYLDRILPDAHVREQTEEQPSMPKKVRYGSRIENDTPQFRPQMMDICYLCGSAPYRVPAKPWTSVTNDDDDDLVSHSVSLYMTWDYPFYAFFDRETFLEDMAKGNLNSDFCSPFLVNALLANTCVSTDDSRLLSLEVNTL
jgi:hypothetical protein